MSDKICLRVGGMIRTMKRRKSPRHRRNDGPDSAGGSDRARKKWGDAHGREVVGRGHCHRLSIQSAMHSARAMPPVMMAAALISRTSATAVSCRAMGQAARLLSMMSDKAAFSLLTASTVAPFLPCFQRDGVVAATPARSQISDIGTRFSRARSKRASTGSVLGMVRHAIGRAA